MSDETTLLPCPFCGGEASKRLFYGARYGVYCDECDARVGGLFNTEAEAIAAWNTRATHGTLTAEQVRKAIFAGSAYASYDGAQYYANGIDMQAIADELNAELGNEREKALEELLDRWHSFAIGNGLDQSCADYEEWCALERATLEQLGR